MRVTVDAFIDVLKVVAFVLAFCALLFTAVYALGVQF